MPEEQNDANPQNQLPPREHQTKPTLIIELAQACEPAANKTPEENQDTVLICEDKPMLAVFDGMGGEAAGGEAAKTAQDAVFNFQPPSDDGPVAVYEAVTAAHKAVWGKREQLAKDGVIDKTEVIGTTATAAYFGKDESGDLQVTIGSIGDSRAYLLRDGKLIQLTTDQNLLTSFEKLTGDEIKLVQTVLNNMTDPETVRLTLAVRAVLIKISDSLIASYGEPESNRDIDDLELEALRILFKRRNIITNYLGNPDYRGKDIPCPIYTHKLQAGDTLLFCTDGLSDNLTDMEIAEILSSAETADEATQKLLQAVRSRAQTVDHPRAKPDDVGLIVARIIEDSQADDEEEN